MHKLLFLSLILLAGCTHTSQPTDISGIWINQTAIDAAAQGRPLVKTLGTHGPNLEWDINARTGKAQSSSSFEVGEGQLTQKAPGIWAVDYNGHGTEELQIDGEHLIQQPARQVFGRPDHPAPAGAQWVPTFTRALNAAYMSGSWKIIAGPGAGTVATFKADGSVSGLGGNDRYELCLGGDCASQNGGHDSLYLGQGNGGSGWIFVRNGKQLEILQAINLSQPDEIPQLTPGPRQWLLEKQ